MSDFEYKVDRFILMQKRKRRESENRDLRLVDLIEAEDPLEIGKFKRELDQAAAKAEDPSLAKEVNEAILAALVSLNRLNRMRRLFSLETINFIGTPEKARLTAESIYSPDREGRKSIAMSFVSTFSGTDQVVTTLANKREIFTEKVVDSMIHALYSFRFDLAARILDLFDPGYVASAALQAGVEPELSLDLLRAVMKRANQAELKRNLKGESLPKALADLITFTQAHRMLPIYAKKRYDFLKLFFIELSNPGRLPGVKPFHTSMLTAAFLESNRQLVPSDELIFGLLDEENFKKDRTKTAFISFLDQLAPTTVDAMIKDIRDLLALVLANPKRSIELIFTDVVRKYDAGIEDQSLLGRVYVSMMLLKDKGLVAFDSVLTLFNEMRSDYLAAQVEGVISLDEIFNEAGDVDSMDEVAIVEKFSASIQRLLNMRQVTCSVVAWRGPGQGATRRGLFAMNYLFGDKGQADHFKKALLRLFYILIRETHKVYQKEYQPPGAPALVAEYFTAYLVRGDQSEPLLFCLGLTHFEKDQSGRLSDKENLAEHYVDPYVFLMTSKTEDTTTLARSRKINDPEINQIDKDLQTAGDRKPGEVGLHELEFKMLNMQTETALKLSYQFLLDLLHKLPDEKWQDPEVQWVLHHILEKLKTLEKG